jgi:hypothetical protein
MTPPLSAPHYFTRGETRMKKVTIAVPDNCELRYASLLDDTGAK